MHEVFCLESPITLCDHTVSPILLVVVPCNQYLTSCCPSALGDKPFSSVVWKNKMCPGEPSLTAHFCALYLNPAVENGGGGVSCGMQGTMGIVVL